MTDETTQLGISDEELQARRLAMMLGPTVVAMNDAAPMGDITPLRDDQVIETAGPEVVVPDAADVEAEMNGVPADERVDNAENA